MQVFDASSMIYAWDNYPIRQFPPLWSWIASQITLKQLVMPVVAFDEVAGKTPECGEWLKDNGIELLQITNEILRDAMAFKGLLGIVNDEYHPKGVGENDLLIIASAKAHGAELVSDEEKQPTLPDVMAKKKIPAVCVMADVGVPCMNFIEYIKTSNAVFA